MATSKTGAPKYTPRQIPDTDDVPELKRFIAEELQVLQKFTEDFADYLLSQIP